MISFIKKVLPFITYHELYDSMNSNRALFSVFVSVVLILLLTYGHITRTLAERYINPCKQGIVLVFVEWN